MLTSGVWNMHAPHSADGIFLLCVFPLRAAPKHHIPAFIGHRRPGWRFYEAGPGPSALKRVMVTSMVWRANLKRAAISFLGFFLLCLPLLDAQSGKKPLRLGDVIDPSGIITPGISNLSWRPGGKQLTYVRPAAGKPATLCAKSRRIRPRRRSLSGARSRKFSLLRSWYCCAEISGRERPLW